jgi:hypothetical protein
MNNRLLYEDVSLVIQGPSIDNEKVDFIDALPYYRSLFSEIILSTYTEHLISNWKLLKVCEKNDIKIVHQTIDIDKFCLDRLINHSIYYQTYTSLNGFKVSTKKYTIKHRIDERYSNLHILIDKFLSDDEKLVSGGTLFAPKVWNPYHVGDHLFISKTEKLIKTFEMSVDYLYGENFIEEGPEYNYTRNFLRIHGENPVDENHDELMRKYFDFVPDKYMFPFVIRSNTNDEGNQVWRTLEEYGPLRSQYETLDDIFYSPYLPW